MSQHNIDGARARRGAVNEPKRKRAREEGRLPSESHAAKPPRSGRNESAALLAPGAAPVVAFPNTNKPMRPANVDQAVRLQSGAAVKRAIGRAMIEEDGDVTGGRFELAEADDMEAAAEAFLDPASHVTGPQRIGNGGELVVATQEARARVPGIIDTLRESPDMLHATASRERLELTGNALTLAVDAAETIKARNSLEKMLAHQMAATHSLAMRFAERASSFLHRYEFGGNPMLSIEASRLANTAARLMGAYQDGLVALERFRRGGRQTVRVVHQTVAVGAGGKAVVAGSVKAGGRRRGGGA